ncbi:MAG: C10 family peptidase [Bacteroidales bacterium]|nr:C10 family peptidase [Candidatus Physcousia equi]
MRTFIIILLFLPTTLFAQHRIKASSGEVLAHSLSFEPDSENESLSETLSEMMKAYRHTQRKANRLRGEAIAPLLRSKRHQHAPFNQSCPYYTYQDGTKSEERCVSGCVATALEQVVSYWRHPAALTDTLFGWVTPYYEIPDVLPGTPLDWEHILDRYEEGTYSEQQAKAVADLIYYLGVAAHMGWGTSSSAASLSSAFDPLYDAFDYKTLAFVQRGFYSSDSWNRLLRNELKNGRPIVYTGHNFALIGHCFVIDGVDEEGYYHCVWGEHNHDGYFDLDYLDEYEPWFDPTPEGQLCGFFTNQTALFMHPDDFVIDISDSLRADDAFRSVRFDAAEFASQPTNADYTRVTFTLTNTTQHALSYTFEAMTYLPTDTEVFKQADYLGLTTVHLQPYETKKHDVYCQFRKTGDRVFGVSADDKTIPFSVPVRIDNASPPSYDYELHSYQLLRLPTEDGGEELCLRLFLDVTNTASNGEACSLHYYCLESEQEAPERRHFGLPQIKAGATSRQVVDFHRLTDGDTYTFFVRYPYGTKNIPTHITVRAEDATAIAPLRMATEKNKSPLFDLNGRYAAPSSRGILIQNGKKLLR